MSPRACRVHSAPALARCIAPLDRAHMLVVGRGSTMRERAQFSSPMVFKITACASCSRGVSQTSTRRSAFAAALRRTRGRQVHLSTRPLACAPSKPHVRAPLAPLFSLRFDADSLRALAWLHMHSARAHDLSCGKRKVTRPLTQLVVSPRAEPGWRLERTAARSGSDARRDAARAPQPPRARDRYARDGRHRGSRAKVATGCGRTSCKVRSHKICMYVGILLLLNSCICHCISFVTTTVRYIRPHWDDC